MKTKVNMEVEIDVKKIVIEVSLRGVGGDEDDDMPTDFPGLNEQKTNWKAVIDIDTGQIEGWPVGDERELFIKVCDAGIYTLFDAESKQIVQMDGYVPNGVVPGEYGDYIELEIGGDGIIKNWPTSPDISEFFEA